jgi:hypothetical protein
MSGTTCFEPIEDGYWQYTSQMPWKKRMCAVWMQCTERHRCYHVLPHHPGKVCLLMVTAWKEDRPLCHEVIVDEEETVQEVG